MPLLILMFLWFWIKDGPDKALNWAYLTSVLTLIIVGVAAIVGVGALLLT